MKGLILAAGLGSRLKHKTKVFPKAMVNVKNKPIISWQIEALKYNNVREVGVVLGYKSEILKDYLLKNHKDITFSFYFNREYETTNSAYSFYIAKEYIKNETYIHLNCDIIFSKELLEAIIISKNTNVIALNKKIDLKDNMEQVELDTNNKIIKMKNMKFEKAVYKAYGVAKFSSESSQYVIKKIEKFLNDSDKNQNYFGILRQAVIDLDYYGIDCNDDLLLEVNTLSDLGIAYQTL